MWHNHGIGTRIRNILDRLSQTGQIVRICGPSHRCGHKPLHENVDAEDVHAGRDEGVDCAEGWPYIVGAFGARDVTCAELGPTFVDSEELEFRGAFAGAGDEWCC